MSEEIVDFDHGAKTDGNPSRTTGCGRCGEPWHEHKKVRNYEKAPSGHYGYDYLCDDEVD